MGAIVLCLTWACATGIITTASRMAWSFARDRGTPFSTYLSKVSRRNKIPLAALFTTTGLACLLTLIYIGSYTAFNDVISLTVTGFYCSYFIPAAFLLHHRIKGNIAPHRSAADDISESRRNSAAENAHTAAGLGKDDLLDSKASAAVGPAGRQSDTTRGRRKVSVVQAQLMWGPFHLPGVFGIINNAYACLYMIFVVFWSVWPPYADTTYVNMNYSVVVTGGVIIFSIVWYYIRGRKEYHGPTVDEEVEAIMRRGSVVAA